MSIVVYQCDTCRRELDLLRNERGLDTVSRCVITQGCKGSLYQIDEKGTGVFGRSLTDVAGLDNYRQRNVLHIHEQLLSSSSWNIEHNLNSNPSVVVYLDTVNQGGARSSTILDMDDYVVNFIDGNNISIQFAVGSTGIAHVISRSSDPDTVEFVQEPTTFDQLSANSVLTIGVPFEDSVDKNTDILLNFISPSTSNVTSLLVEFTPHNFDGEISLFNTPWQDTDLIYTNGRIYKLKSLRVDSIMSSQDIERGSPFYFDDTNFILLTSNEPYSSLNVDINDQRVYVPSKIEPSGVGSNTSAKDGEFFIDPAQTIHLHPPIKTIKNIFG